MVKINLSTLLGARRMTQADLARHTGIRPSTINDMYHELCVRVNLEHIDKICEVLECDITDLFEYVPNKIKTTGKELIVEAHGNRKNITNYKKTALWKRYPQGCFSLNCRNISAKIFILCFLMFFILSEKFFHFLRKATDNKIIGFGDDITKTDIHPIHQTEYDEENGYYKVWPIDTKKVERKWRYERGTVEGIQHLLRVVPKNGYFEIELGKDFESYRTVWTDKLYDANEYGTKILNSMVPKNDFSYPKSVYNVRDCLLAVVRNNPNAVILDFFAGSGTTAHAVQLINKEFGGNRQFILCTNNAIGEKREKEYKKKYGGIKPELKRWKKWCEKYGIASSITYPRIQSLYFGYTHASDEKTVLFAQKIGINQLKNDKLYKKMDAIKVEHKDNYDSIKFVIENSIAKVIGITSKASGIEGIPANLKYYKCALIPKASVPRKTLKAIGDFIDCFIMIKENVFEKRDQIEPFKEYYSTRLNKQVFVYTKSYVDTNDLNVLSRNITMSNVILYVNEAIVGDEYLSELKDVQVKAIPRNILRGEFYE